MQFALVAVCKPVVIPGQLFQTAAARYRIPCFSSCIFSPSLKKIEALPKGKAPIKRFLSIHRIYSACGFRSTHGRAPQSADTEPVYCFIANDSWSMPLSSNLIISQKRPNASTCSQKFHVPSRYTQTISKNLFKLFSLFMITQDDL